MKSKSTTLSGQKNSQTTLAPRLRFPKFRNSTGWTKIELRTIADPILERVSPSEKNSKLRLSAENEILLDNQLNPIKETATGTKRYLRITFNDFIYSDRTSKHSPYGTFKRLSAHPGGIISDNYKCFRFHPEENPIFWELYFESGIHNTQLNSFMTAGIGTGRNHISISQLMSTNVWYPDKIEQQNIVECLQPLSELIVAKNLKLNWLKIHKKTLAMQLLPNAVNASPTIRFPEFKNSEKWKETLCGKVIKLIPGRDFKTTEHSNSGVKLLRLENIGPGKTTWPALPTHLPKNYLKEFPELVLHEGDIVLALNLPTKNNELKISKIKKYETPAMLYKNVEKLETTDKSLNKDFAFQAIQEITKGMLADKILGSGPPTISLKELYSKIIFIPSIEEQIRIAECLSSADDLIALHNEEIETLRQHKEALMQQLFPSPVGVN